MAGSNSPFHRDGVLSLVEKYSFSNHARKRLVVERLLTEEQRAILAEIGLESGLQLPDLLVFSGDYRAVCHEEMRALVPIVLAWRKGIPADRKHLLVGIKVVWESSIDLNAWHDPNSNALLDRPGKGDPVAGLKTDELPGRGVVTIGFAAVTDERSLPARGRKRQQMEHAPHQSTAAKQVKSADKSCHIAEITPKQPVGWELKRKAEDRAWGEKVVAGCRRCNAEPEAFFATLRKDKRKELGIVA